MDRIRKNALFKVCPLIIDQYARVYFTKPTISARVVLCATKTDLRDQQKDCITTDMGQKLSKQIGAIEYVEVRYVTMIPLRDIPSQHQR